MEPSDERKGEMATAIICAMATVGMASVVCLIYWMLAL